MSNQSNCNYYFALASLWIIIFSQPVNAQLVMEAHIYQKIVEEVHSVFNNTCVIYIYTSENPMQSLGLFEAAQLMSIPLYTARLHVRSFAYAIKTFKEMIGDNYFNLKRPLFILLNDYEEMRKQFSKEIAPWIAMAYINWVIFFRDDTSIDEFFSEIYVPLDCIFLIVKKYNSSSNVYALWEVYQIDKGRELITNEFGSWSFEDGLTYTKYALYQRRGDLQGQLIRVAAVEDPPVSMIERDNFGNMIGIKGFFGTIIGILQENLNCTVTYSSTDHFGMRLPNGKWTGAVGMLVDKETDLVAAEMMMSADRLEVVEYTTPVFSTKCRTFIKRPTYTAIKWTAYSDPFEGGIWFSMLIVLIISSFFILIGFKALPSRVKGDTEDAHSGFSDTFFLVFSDICGQGESNLRIDSIRLIHQVVHMTGVVILSAYSAALISFLAVKVFVMPFTTMEGLLEDGSYKFGVVGNSSDYSFFATTSDKTLQRMFDEILDDVDKLPNNYYEGLNLVCREDKYSFMITDNMFAILEHLVPCILEPLETIMQTTLAMAVPVRSPFRGIINSNILLMRDSGVLQRVIATELLVEARKNNDGFSDVEIVDVLPLLLLVLGGVSTGWTILTIEKFKYSKLKNFGLSRILRNKFTQQRKVVP